MDNAKKESVAYLRQRWDSDSVLVQAKERLYALAESQSEYFAKRNRRRLNIEYEQSAYPDKWIEQNDPSLFRAYLDLQEELKGRWPRVTDEADQVERLDFRGLTLPVEVRGFLIERVDFSFCIAESTRFYHSDITGCLFAHIDMEQGKLGMRHRYCRFEWVRFPRFRNHGIFEDCFIAESALSQCDSEHLYLKRCVVQICDFRKSGLGYSRFEDSGFFECNFRRSYLDLCTFENNRFERCDFANTWEGVVPLGVVSTVQKGEGEAIVMTGLQWLGVEGSLEDFLRACGRLGVPLVLGEEFSTYDQVIFDIGSTGQSDVLGVCESEGRLYIWGDSAEMPLAPDFIVSLSREMGSTVAAGTAERRTGSYFLCVAREGRLQRLYNASYWDRAEVFEKGQPLSWEGLASMDDPSGKGVELVLTGLGFDFERARREGTKPFQTLVFDKKRRKALKGEIGDELERFLADAPKGYTPNTGVRVIDRT